MSYQGLSASKPGRPPRPGGTRVPAFPRYALSKTGRGYCVFLLRGEGRGDRGRGVPRPWRERSPATCVSRTIRPPCPCSAGGGQSLIHTQMEHRRRGAFDRAGRKAFHLGAPGRLPPPQAHRGTPPDPMPALPPGPPGLRNGRTARPWPRRALSRLRRAASGWFSQIYNILLYKVLDYDS